VPLDVNDGIVLAKVVVVENVCDAAFKPFNVYNPLLPHTALPLPSLVKTAPFVSLVVFTVVALTIPVLSVVAVMVPVFNEVDEIFPEDTTEVAVMVPAANPPLPSRLTIVFDVLEEVAEVIADENVL
jgi:hypothetical protein